MLSPFVFSFLQKKNKFVKYYFITPIISLGVLIVFAFYASFVEVDAVTRQYEWTINWLFYIIMTMHILTILFSILLKIKRFEDITTQVENQKISRSNDTVSSTDEIMRYKELLDSGVISQEEFNAKKKQLLRL